MVRYFYGLLILCFNLSAIAQENIDSLKQVVQSSSGEEKIKTLNALCYAYAYMQADSARAYGMQALSLQGETDTELLAETLHYLAITYQVQSRYSEALAHDEHSLQIRTRLKDSLGMANTINNIAVIYDEQGRYRDAVQAYLKAYELYKRHGSEIKLALVNVNLGVVFKGIGEHQNSINNYKEALKKFVSLKRDYETAVCHVNLGSVFIAMQHYDSALYYSLQAEKLFQQLGYVRFEAVATGNAGIAHGKLGHTAEAISFLQRAIKNHRANNNRKELAYCYLKLAEVYMGSQQNPAAITASQQALQTAQDAEALQQQADASLLLANLYQKVGNFKEAFTYQSNHLRLRDSLFQTEKVKQVRKLQIQYDTEKKERELAESKASLAQGELEIRKRDNQLFLILSGVVALLLFGFILYRNARERQQQLILKAELAEARTQNALQEERLRISQELHDNIGSQLTFVNASIGALLNEADNSRLNDVKKLTGETIRELRKTVWLMNHQSTTLEEFVIKLRDYILTGSQIPIAITVRANSQQVITAQVANHLFRIVQESVNNTHKHAEATQITITIDLPSAEQLSVTIADNGKGFNTNSTQGGFGLAGMQKRVSGLGGKLSIQSQAGTTITAQLPL
ncbi:MAG: tetratricopeptide repeat protein [Cyclobacteriaceae bacterium]|nr:MAG: tetratricopeptide repeat protein [Cyclobacteriaceae bacterium]